ncbi:L-serine ammonia-lyase, iron-sulfur-dependent subunit beta [Gelria sp. Kuro-4]|uniref:L-serine ammonia-lyase, iron-sulfur-dependent subunit beta n=1 Tax=Gelria sp. Kuro-4 TaxID=2796927 RepID=UPI001BF175DF|nr:L-serine ammonia-lyase, iron-sulfur-dependent subunit beta [Gelria sp. Kuro-4]BCV23379.1 L-serine dehydratase, iron-sulfur-dependent subunit beta [Gelria sp. Kuro-4]
MSGSGIFTIIGPVMVGPSSSHTAGAARLGWAARAILGTEPVAAAFYLHGSFAETGRGHGTDRALLAGVLGLGPADSRLPAAYRLAEAAGLKYAFYTQDLGDAHPNTVKIVLRGGDGSQVGVTGSSIGGGEIVITAVDDLAVEFSCHYPTLLTLHQDQPGMVARVSVELAAAGVNIAFMRVFRRARGGEASMVVEMDEDAPEQAVARIAALPGMRRVRVVKAVSAC